MITRVRVSGLLKQTPGPTPWYWHTLPPVAGCEWKTGEDHQVWLERAGEPVLVVGNYVWGIPAGEGQAVFWIADQKSPSVAATVFLYDLAKLTTVELQKEPTGILSGIEPRQLRLPQAESGYIKAPVCPEITVSEVFLVTKCAESTDPDAPQAAIYEWHPQTGDCRVYPQLWFTARSMDIGYQWITQVGRDPHSGHLFGSGIRIGNFILDESCTRLAKLWGSP